MSDSVARRVVVSAPGKMMIAGEYAVLEGAEALVAAVSRRVRLTLDPDRPRDSALPPEVVASRARAEARLGSVAGGITLDVSELRSGERKLGLGSSSAAAAAAASAVYAAHGVDTTDPVQKRALLEDADQGHRAVAPAGSGADVAAAVLGGFVRFRRGADGIAAEPLDFPDTLQLSVVWTGVAVRTSDMVAKVGELRLRDPQQHRACIDAIERAAAALIDALTKNDAALALQAFEAHGLAMQALGTAASAPIVDDTSQKIRSLARQHGGAAKPSGAGGGDIVLAAFGDKKSREGFESGCAEGGYEVLSIVVGDVGERVEES